MKYKTWIIVIAVIILLPFIGWGIKSIVKPESNLKPEELQEQIFITSNPVDLTQIIGISRFRSCAGHWYGEESLDGKEASSSLKHYFVPLESLSSSNDKIKIFAPFDGKIENIDDSGRGQHLTLVPDNYSAWNFTIYHINPIKNFKEGDKFKSGDLMGYASIGQKGNDFDFSLNVSSNGENSHLRNIDSIFNHMTDSVLAEYEKVGATKNEMIIDSSIRNASPCPCKEGEPGTTYCNFPTDYMDPTSYFKLSK